MENFTKSILNYFAAYNETRFRFTTKIAQMWSNDELTLNLSVFPDFQDEIIKSIRGKNTVDLKIKKLEYKVEIPYKKFKQELKPLINKDLLLKIINTIRSEIEDSEIEDDEEIYRLFAIQFRKDFSNILLNLQEKEKDRIIAENNLEYLPLSTLNTVQIEQYVFEEIIKISKITDSDNNFIDSVTTFLSDYKPDLILFDLYTLLLGYSQYVGTQSLYIYFHNFFVGDQVHPLIAIEVDLTTKAKEEFEIRASRDLVYINTPAINSAKLGNILTTPRACTFADLEKYITQIELYLEAYYKNSGKFILKPFFRKIVGKDLPDITARIGFQIIPKEDRKILDYSELITQIKSGAGEKFKDLVSTYVDKNVENTTGEVNEAYDIKYPKRSYKNFITDIPLSLNQNQRKILTAAENPKNKMIVVDGPPGTGKSYTITALVYLANLLGKSVVVSSHKTQALDVVEEKLTSQFQRVHPNAKPPILRLTKANEDSLNNINNTLSSSVINATNSRVYNFNEELIEQDLVQIERNIEENISNFWNTHQDYEDYVKKQSEFFKLHTELFDDSQIPHKPDNVEKPNLENIIKSINALNIANADISLDTLKYFINNKDKLEKWEEELEELKENTIYTEGGDIDEEITKNINEVIKNLKPILNSLDENTQLKDIYLEDTEELPSRVPLAEKVSFEKLENSRRYVEELDSRNRNIATKMLGSKRKRELEHILELDYPEVKKHIDKIGTEKTLFEIKSVYRHIEETRKVSPFLSGAYIYEQPYSLSELKESYRYLKRDKVKDILALLSTKQSKSTSELTISELKKGLYDIENKYKSKTLYESLNELFSTFNLEQDQTTELKSKFTTYKNIITEVQDPELTYIDGFFDLYENILLKLGINRANLQTINKLNTSSLKQKLQNYIDLHFELSLKEKTNLRTDLIKQYEEKRLKVLENINQKRLSGLLNYSGDVQRILNTIANNKRLTEEQAEVLFKNVPCVIAPPELISEYIPMKKDLFDWLIIDEASQVSIAESLSLILRSKQSIVFGDEFQYGAVGAVNVNLEYSKQYFKEVLNDYIIDKNESLSTEDIEKIATEVSQNIAEDDITVPSRDIYKVEQSTKEWLKTFSIRTSTLSFARALANYSDSLTTHFRSYPEIISYSNETFYKPNEINLVTSRIRTKPIKEVLEFIKVDTKGNAGNNINLDEIEVIKDELTKLHNSKYKGTLGIICSFREQTERMTEILRKDLDFYPNLERENNLKIWFVGDVQGEERKIIFYSFVEDKNIENASLYYIYPVIGGQADDVRNLRMQRLNVGFSRAEDKMVFVHSMPLEEYMTTRLGYALKHYSNILTETKDYYIEDTTVFDSPAEQNLYNLITQTDFFKENIDNLKLVAQFEIGKYIKEEFRKNIPKYRVDFLLTLSKNGHEKALIIEYDGLEYHTKDPYNVYSATTFDKEYLDYDLQRQLEIETYGYKFLRINKFNILPKEKGRTELDVLNDLLIKEFIDVLTSYEEHTPNISYRVKDSSNDSVYQSDIYRSPMEEKLHKILLETDFYKEHRNNLGVEINKKIKNYEADLLLKLKESETPFKLVIEYDGVKFHSNDIQNVTNDKEMVDSLTNEDIYRQNDLEDLGYMVLRVNKFNLFENDNEVENLNDMIETKYKEFKEKYVKK